MAINSNDSRDGSLFGLKKNRIGPMALSAFVFSCRIS